MNLKKTAFRGASWTLAGAVISAILFILRPAILTRFLEKEDFGLMAILLLVVGISHLFSDLGVSASLYSQQQISRREYSSLFWFGMIIAVIIYLIIAALAIPLAAFYKIPALSSLIPLIALEILIVSAGRQFQVFLQKDLRFRSLALIEISAALLSLLLAVWLAIQGYGIYSLVWSVLAASALRSILLISVSWRNYPLLLSLDIKNNRRFYRIGIFQTGSQLLDYIAANIDIIIIGKLMSTADLGVYNLVKQLIVRPYGMINHVIIGVSLPILGKLRENIVRQQTAFLEMLRLAAFANLPVYGLMAIFAPQILLLLYGPAYTVGAPWMQWLSLWGATAAIVSAASSIILVKGRTDLGFRWTILRVVSQPLLIFAGALFGVVGISIAHSLAGAAYLLAYFPVLIKPLLVELRFSGYLRAFGDLLLQAIILALAAGSIALWLFRQQYALAGLIIPTVLFAGGFLALNRRQLIFLASFIRQKENNS